MAGAGWWGWLGAAALGPLAALAVVTPSPGDAREAPAGEPTARPRSPVTASSGAVAGTSPSAPAVAAGATPSGPVATPSRRPAAVVERGNGRPVVVAGDGPVRGEGPLQTYTVAVEGAIGVAPAGFARAVEAILADPRSWGAAGRMSFRRVDSGAVAFRVVLASPTTTDRLCAPLDTGGIYSCAVEGTAVINAGRWLQGARSYGKDLTGYRQYLVNHEVGHTLGHGHTRCPGRGQLAPVMVQQTKGVGSCRPNPWPYPSGR